MFVFTHLAIFRLTAINDCFGINTPTAQTLEHQPPPYHTTSNHSLDIFHTRSYLALV